MNIIMEEHRPSPVLSPYIEFFWEGHFNTGAGGRLSQRVVPNGYLELIIHLTDEHCELLRGTTFSASPDYLLIGLFTQPYQVEFARPVRVLGIRFKPEGVYPLLGASAAELGETTADAEALTGRRFREFCRRLREQPSTAARLALSEHFFQEQLRRREVEHYYLHRAAELIRRSHGQLSIDHLAGRVHISRRQLEREFKEKIGLTPKHYSRIARLNKANRLLEAGRASSLTALAYASGYTDQAHFIREFKLFTGENPSAFLQGRGAFIVNPNAADGGKSEAP